VKEWTIDKVRSEVAGVCLPLDIKATTLEYSDYCLQKTVLSKCNYVRFAQPLAWLYDPDSWRQDMLPLADWGSDYNYVVILEGANTQDLSHIANELFSQDWGIGLILIFQQ
jgi:hypothetical protein